MSLIINYVICVIYISKKLKYLKNEARESKTIFSVLSNKTNLILGFSSPLTQHSRIKFLCNIRYSSSH